MPNCTEPVPTSLDRPDTTIADGLLLVTVMVMQAPVGGHGGPAVPAANGSVIATGTCRFCPTATLPTESGPNVETELLVSVKLVLSEFTVAVTVYVPAVALATGIGDVA